MKKLLPLLCLLLFAASVSAQKGMKFNGKPVKYGNYEVPKTFATESGQTLLCVYITELDSIEMHKYASEMYKGEYEIISYKTFEAGDYKDESKYRFILTADSYVQVDSKTNVQTGGGFTMFCIYDMKLGTKHLHNRDRKLDRYFKLIEETRLKNTK